MSNTFKTYIAVYFVGNDVINRLNMMLIIVSIGLVRKPLGV